MSRETKRLKVKSLIEEGSVKTIEDLTIFMGVTAIGNILGSNTDTVNSKLSKPATFKFEDAYALANHFDVPSATIFKLIDNLYVLKTKEKKKH